MDYVFRDPEPTPSATKDVVAYFDAKGKPVPYDKATTVVSATIDITDDISGENATQRLLSAKDDTPLKTPRRPRVRTLDDKAELPILQLRQQLDALAPTRRP
jgi:hypothetical protein